MNLFRLFFELLIIYIIYKVVIDLVLPLSQSARIIKKKAAEIRKEAENSRRQETRKPETSKGDYIDFEEVK